MSCGLGKASIRQYSVKTYCRKHRKGGKLARGAIAVAKQRISNFLAGRRMRKAASVAAAAAVSAAPRRSVRQRKQRKM